MKKILTKLNYPLLLLTVIYAIFGLLMIYSASNVSSVLYYQVPTYHFLIKQLVFELVMFFIGIIILFVPTGKYRYFSRVLLAVFLIMAIALFAFGKIAGGARSWYKVGKASFQPTEFLKITLIIYLAVHYHRVGSKPKTKKVTFWEMFFPILISLITFLIVAAQPDLGGALIIGIIVALIFFSLPFGKEHKRFIFKLGILGVIIFGIAIFAFGQNFFYSYQIERFLNFSKPCERYNTGENDTGYQVCNGYMAIHNGGLTGVGLGESTQKRLWLPEAHTDFIFPIICEELGLIVGIAIITGYFIMLFIILNIAKEARTLRNSILAYGIFTYFMSHILINILGVLGLIPLTGVPLPFLSYGGSYSWCVIIALYIVQRINIENKEEEMKEKIASI